MVVGLPAVVVVVSCIPHTEHVVAVCCSGWAETFDGFFLLVGMGLV